MPCLFFLSTQLFAIGQPSQALPESQPHSPLFLRRSIYTIIDAAAAAMAASSIKSIKFIIKPLS